MMRVCDILLPCIIAVSCFFLGVAAVQGQLIPPPPVVSVADSSFTEKDRKKLNDCWHMMRAIHTKLFPMSVEQRLLESGTVEP